jgi:5-methylcytosine-specific restriction endonuclease McrA
MYRCKVCNKKIGLSSGQYGSQMCRSCSKIKINISSKKLYKEYIINNRSICKIAKLYNCSAVTIYNKLIKYHIKIKTRVESHIGKIRPDHSKRMKGKNNPMYINGNWTELYPFEWTKIFKQQIRQRDNFECQNCGIKECKCSKKLNIHHIDYNKKNLNNDNLISLCNSCHSKTNIQRNYWQKILRRITNG